MAPIVRRLIYFSFGLFFFFLIGLSGHFCLFVFNVLMSSLDILDTRFLLDKLTQSIFTHYVLLFENSLKGDFR